MTNEEVQEIYDYLHANYEYRDGELIAKNEMPKRHKKKGDPLGGWNNPESGRPSITGEIRLNGKRYCFKLAHYIFLFHTNKKAKSLLHVDNNPLNNKIENLKELEARYSRAGRMSLKENKGYYQRPQNKNGNVTVVVRRNRIVYHIGLYDCIEKAKKAYAFASKLLMETHLDKPLLIKIVREKYPTIERKNKRVISS